MKKLINSILILFALISIVNSIQDTLSEEDVKLLEKALHDSSEYMKMHVKDEDVAICIGATRPGKSTLINYLIGNKLKAERLSRVQPVTILKADSQSLGPEIGNGSTSKTTIPTRWASKNFPEMAIWDAPGFDDNRGPVQDITNAFYLYQLVQNVKSLKIVLVVDINDILQDNIKPFITVLKAVESLLGKNIRYYFTSISIIFTKVPDSLDDIPVDMQYINEKLTYQFLSSSDMNLSQVSKDFIKFIISNNEHVALFKRASDGDVTSAIDVNIFPVIKNSRSIQKETLKELSPSISETSKLCLHNVREKLLPTSAFVDLEKVVGIICDKKISDLENLKNNESINEIRTRNKELTIIHNRLYNALVYESDFYKKMESLYTVDDAIKKKIEEQNLLEKIKLMEFVDKLLDMEESKQLAFSLQGVLLSSASRVKQAITTVQLKLAEIIQRKHDEEIRNERERHQKQITTFVERIQELVEKINIKKNFLERLHNLFFG